MGAEREVKPRSRGAINAPETALAGRHLGRIETLRGAIEKAQNRLAEFQAAGDGDRVSAYTDRIASLSEELDRRLSSLRAIKDEVEALLAGGQK